MNHVVYAWYHSIYNKGKYDVVALCKVDTIQQTVFDIEGVHLPKHIDSLDEEYVEMVDGTRMEVVIAPEDRGVGRLLLGF